MYVIYADDKPIYAATDEHRFRRELAKYASMANVTWRLAQPSPPTTGQRAA